MGLRRLCGLCLAAIGALLVSAPVHADAQRAPVVAAAADLNIALPEIADRFLREQGQRVDFVFGSSGTLAGQIRNGAPFDVFLSADEEFVTQLQSAGLTRDGGTLYGIGRIVLFAPTGSPLVPSAGLDGLATLIATGRATRFAIANPEHAPYGRAAEAALRKRGIWESISPHLVLGENVSQAAQFATTGNAMGGIIAYSLALSPALKARGTFALIPENDHLPLRQRMVLLKTASDAASRFYAYLQQPESRSILQRYGFVVPGR